MAELNSSGNLTVLYVGDAGKFQGALHEILLILPVYSLFMWTVDDANQTSGSGVHVGSISLRWRPTASHEPPSPKVILNISNFSMALRLSPLRL